MDQNTFAARTQAIKARLYRTAYLYLGSEADALEAVDEAVYQALRSLKKLREPAFFETWITRILINQCHRELRRRYPGLIHLTAPIGVFSASYYSAFSGKWELPFSARPDIL